MPSLDGPRLKIVRAKAEIEELKRLEDVFQKESKYQIVKEEFNPKSGKYVYRVSTSSLPPSLEWGVYIGEIAHNLRSALDELVYQLALLKTNTPAGNTQFPIFLFGNTKKKIRGKRKELIPHFEGMRRSDGRSMIRNLSPKHQGLIERLQPYKRGRGRRNSFLYLLHEVNNADKHRLIQVVAPKIGMGPMVSGWDSDGAVRFYKKSGFGILKNGAKFGEAPPHVHVNSDVIPFVVFWNGCEAVKGRGVCVTLSRIAEHVSQIIESFSPAF